MNNMKISKENIAEKILEGKIFIYPTDTIYGIGCDATNEKAVNQIKNIKERDKDKPLSIIAPNISWILNNFETTEEEIKKYLPGPYTLLLKKKDMNFLNWVSNNDRIGIRIPNSSFTKEIIKSNVPFITPSVNLSGEPFALTVKDIKPEILNKIDYIIEADKEEKLSGKPSTLIIEGKEIQRK
ncbi:MAG: L-threonylcarbamoyladenylate synthase [archaeon]|nr:L-threonylcarbamoyladenylate synthase [archaeon]